MARQVEARTVIAAPRETIWGLLVEPRSWSSWWSAVSFARSKDFKPLREGSRFEVTLETGRLRSTLRPRVSLAAEHRTLVWEGRWMGVPCRQEWFLSRDSRGCRVQCRTTFQGIGAAVLRLLRLEKRWRTMTDRQVRDLKGVAERML